MHTMRMVLIVILTTAGVGTFATPAIGGGMGIPLPDTQIGKFLYYNGGIWKIESLRDQVVAATITAASARLALMAKIKGDFEPILTKILNGNAVTPPAQNNRAISRSWSSAPTPVTSITRYQSMQVARNSPQNLISGVMSRGITSRVVTPLPQVSLDELRQNFVTATENQKKVFEQYSSLVVQALKSEGQLSGALGNLYSYSNNHVKILTIMSPLVWDYFTTLFTLGVNQSLVGCNVDVVGKQLIRTSATNIADVVKFNDSLRCLFPSNIKKIDHALASAFTMTMKVVSTLHPGYAPVLQGDLLLRLGPVALNVFDATKSDGSLLYPALVKYVAIASGQSLYKKPVYMKSGYNYVDPWNQIALYSPKSKKTEVVPLCGFSEWDNFVAKNPGVQWVEAKKLPVASEGAGPKTRWGVLLTQVDSVAQSLKTKPYPITYTAASGNKGAECVLDTTSFYTLSINPVLLGDGHCSYWESARTGLGCGGKKFVPGTSASLATALEGVTRVAKAIGEWLMPSVWAETPTGPCEELKKLEDMLFCADKLPSDQLKSCITTVRLT